MIGYQFGGSGTTFNLPAPAGRVMGIIGAGTGLTPRAMGDISGTETHVLTVGEMPDHTHTINDPGHFHTFTDNTTANNNVTRGLPVANQGANSGTATVANQTDASGTGITINPTGGAGSSTSNQSGGLNVAASAHNNMQPTLFVGNLFIYSGVPTYGTWPITTLNAKSQPFIQ